ncbi:MAG: hypothetical protein HQL25_03495, partial [Candidatus Omnitrophica bacterium]|nr:hypothetical protein [Candidatus Omnitrophota bacterium]
MLNVENKKQIMTIFFAVALGIVAVFITAKYVSDSIQKENQRLKKEFESKMQKQMKEQEAAFINELQKNRQEMEAKMKMIVEETAKIRSREQTPKNNKVVPMQAFALQTPAGKRALTVL